MPFYPIHVDLRDKRCIVVGGGSVGERKVTSLLDYGAHVRLVAPVATPALRALAQAGRITWMKALYHGAHLEDGFLAIAATDLAEINAAVVRDADERNMLVCSVSSQADGNFVSPAQVVRGDLVLTASTSGLSPTLAAVLREDLAAAYGDDWAETTRLFGALRKLLKEQFTTEDGRKAAVRTVLADSGVREALKRGDLAEAEALARKCL